MNAPVHITHWPVANFVAYSAGLHVGDLQHSKCITMKQEFMLSCLSLYCLSVFLKHPCSIITPSSLPPDRHESLKARSKKVLNHTQGPIGSYNYILFPSDFLLTNTKRESKHERWYGKRALECGHGISCCDEQAV